MKSISSSLKSAARLVRGIFLLTLIGMSGFTPASSQTIIGKWNQMKIITYYTAEGAKKNGSPESEIQMSSIGSATYVFYDNHTYRMESTTGNSKVVTLLGTWSLSGNILEMKLLPQQEDPKNNPKTGAPAESTTVDFHGNIMEWTSNHLDDAIISKIVLTFAKNS